MNIPILKIGDGNKIVSKKQDRQAETMCGDNLHTWFGSCFAFVSDVSDTEESYKECALTSWVHPGCWLHSSSWVIHGLTTNKTGMHIQVNAQPLYGMTGYDQETAPVQLENEGFFYHLGRSWAKCRQGWQATHGSAADSWYFTCVFFFLLANARWCTVLYGDVMYIEWNGMTCMQIYMHV